MYSGWLSNLAGMEVFFQSPVTGNGVVEQTESFYLAPGVIVAEFRHDGTGDFKVELITESGVQAPPSDLGFGMRLLNTLGWVSSELDGNWVAFESHGRLLLFNLCGIPYGGEFFLRVHTTDRWQCRIFQPYAGQAWCTFDQAPTCSGSIGQSVLGPFTSSSSRLECFIQLHEAAYIDNTAFSLDGNDETVIFDGRGDSGSMQHYAGLNSDTEYLVFVNCSGDWNLSFSEV